MTLDTINNGESGLSARTKINAVIGAVNATVPIVTPNIAYVETTGDDSTGAVGDPTKPFATLLAAYSAGARVFDIGVGLFAGMTVTSLDIMLMGKGAGRSFVDTIQGTSGDVHGNGRENISINNIFVNAASGTNGSPGMNSSGGPPATPGSNGGNGSSANVMISGLLCGSVALSAGSGGNGGQGGSGDNTITPANGGNGGSGGDAGTLTIQDCTIGEYATNMAGNGGGGGNGGSALDNSQGGALGGSGGNGGAGGEIILIRTQVGGTYAAPSTGGGGGAGGNGNDGPASGGNNGNAGSAGSVNTLFTQSASDVSNGETTTYRASLINGTWYS